MNKQFFGEATDKEQLTCVQNRETKEMLNDPDAMLEYVQSSFWEQAKPASGFAKTGAFRPNDANRKCPWKDGPYSSIDPFTPETVAGKPGFRSISLLEHVCDPCIFQEKMRHLESTWSWWHPKWTAQASTRRGAPDNSQTVHLDVDDGNNAQLVEGVSNSALA